MGRSDGLPVGRIIILVLAVLSAGVNTLFGLTDAAWRLMGSPSESYPEILFIGVGMPLALAAMAGALSGLWTRRGRRDGGWKFRAILWITVASLVGSSLLAATVFLPPTIHTPAQPNALADAIFAALFFLSPILMGMQFGLVIAGAMGGRKDVRPVRPPA